MPPELDPAYDRFARPLRRETPTEAMKRIERDLRSADIEQPERPNTQPGRFVAGAGRNLEGYNANIGTQGPLSGGLIAAADPDTGRPVMVGGKAQAGPLSYQVTQPTFKGAPASHQVSIGGQPFDADAYFGVSAKQGPDGRTYGASAGGEGWNVYGGYNPTTKGVNVGGEYRANFADGGEVRSLRQAIADLQGPEAQSPIDGRHAESPSLEGMGQGMQLVGEGMAPLGEIVGEYARSRYQEPGKLVGDVQTAGRAIKHAVTEDPFGAAAGLNPVVGAGQAAMSISDIKDAALRAKAEGDDTTYRKLAAMAAAAAVGAIIPGVHGVAGDLASIGKATSRELSPLGFYSHGAETAAGLQQAKGTPQQFYSMLEKGGVKPAELEGFHEAFANRPSVTREEIAQHFKERMPQVEETVLGGDQLSLKERHRYFDLEDRVRSVSSDVRNSVSPAEKQEYDALQKRYNQESSSKFGQYTLPGGENYREVLLKMPSSWEPKIQEKYGRFGFEGPDGTYRDYWTKADAEQAARSFRRDSGDFKSSHWDDPNVLAHLRMADRTGPNGEKILHVEEIQSDWGQKGKKEGFKQPGEPAGLSADETARFRELINIPQIRRTPAQQTELDALNATGDRRLKAPPSAPYVTNTQAWTDLALKRALREAAEGGYDKLVWTPGVEQAKRYSLRNQVDELRYIKNDDGTYNVVPFKGDRPLHNIERENIPEKELEGLFGRDVAEKMRAYEGDVSGNVRSLSGQNLEVGGEGMKGYYDKIVPNQLSKLVKKLDPEAKIETYEIRTTKESDLRRKLRERGYDPDQIEVQELLSDNGGRAPREFTEADLDAMERGEHFDGVSQKGVTAPSLTITPKMREAILKGQTAFAEGGEVKSGGRAVVGHTSAAGLPISLEEHKGEIRHRAHSGDSKMAADYGYISNSKPDADGMKVDTYVGPHHDSKRIFIINQQHPHTKRFNEHKVMLGYKDRSHAVHDYVHSFSDGNGHKRIASIVEMDSHQLKDWLRKGNLHKPTHGSN